MKIKSKFLKISSLMLVSAFLAAPMTACHTHVIVWHTKKDATCVETGIREGVCNLCGHVEEEVIPVDPNAHTYGEWQVTAPTNEEKGVAEKTCKNDSSHMLEIELPVLTPNHEGYLSSQVIKEPTAFEKGERQYVFAHESGDVVFVVPIDEVGIRSVRDAVQAALANREQVRRGTILMAQDRNHYEPSRISYEFGNDYVHIIDNADNIERWYSLEDGKFYGMIKDPIGGGDDALKSDTSGREYLKGYRFGIPYAGSDFRMYYGAEDLADGIYNFIKRNNNKDFYEEIDENGGETYYKASYNYVNGNTYFCMLDLSFTLSPSYALKTLTFECKQYIKGTFEYDEETGVGNLIDPDSPDNFFYDTYIEYEQTLLEDLTQEERDNVPVNPYGKDYNKIVSFGLDYLGESVDEKLVSIPANAMPPSAFAVVNVEPSNANLSLDPIDKVYYIENGRDIELSANTLNTVGAIGYYDANRGANGAVMLRCQFAGERKFAVVTTSGFRKEFTINVTRTVPTRLNPSVYERSSHGGSWNDSVNTATVYVGQRLFVRALAPDGERAYTDSSFTPSVGGTGATVREETFRGESVAEFVATQTGEFTVTLASKLRPTLRTTITVTVREAPSVADILTGTYTATVNEAALQGEFKLEFTPSGSGATAGEARLTVNADASSYTVYSYRYEANTEQPAFAGTLVTEHKEGAVNRAVTVRFTDAYTIEIVYETEFTDSNGEKIVVVVPLAKTAE